VRLLLVFLCLPCTRGLFADSIVVVGATSLPSTSSVTGWTDSGTGIGTVNGTTLSSSTRTSAGDKTSVGMRLLWVVGELVMLRFI
jgi:hypothetical protein